MKAKERRKQESEKRRVSWKSNAPDSWYVDFGVFRLSVSRDIVYGSYVNTYSYTLKTDKRVDAVTVGGGSGYGSPTEAKTLALCMADAYLQSCREHLERISALFLEEEGMG